MRNAPYLHPRLDSILELFQFGPGSGPPKKVGLFWIQIVYILMVFLKIFLKALNFGEKKSWKISTITNHFHNDIIFSDEEPLPTVVVPHESSEEEDDYLAYLKGDDDFLEKYDNEHAKFKAAQRSMEKHQQARVSKVPNVVIDNCINFCPNHEKKKSQHARVNYCPASEEWQWHHVLFTNLSGTCNRKITCVLILSTG